VKIFHNIFRWIQLKFLLDRLNLLTCNTSLNTVNTICCSILFTMSRGSLCWEWTLVKFRGKWCGKCLLYRHVHYIEMFIISSVHYFKCSLYWELTVYLYFYYVYGVFFFFFFRWDTKREWERQLSNFERLFDHINSHDELNVKVQWGTLEDYFNALREESKVSTKLFFISLIQLFLTCIFNIVNSLSQWYFIRTSKSF